VNSKDMVVIDIQQALLYHDDNEQFLRETLRLFVNQHADDASQLQKALATGDLQTARLQVHSLRNIAALIGARMLHSVCGEMELHLKSGETSPSVTLEILDHRLSEVVQSVRIPLDVD